MSNQRSLSRSFAAGEITPELFGRLDLTAFQTGLATCRNFEALPHGPVANRPGFEFVHAARYAGVKSRLIPFVYSNEQTFAIEFGSLYLRFHTMGGTLLDGSAPYEIATPYLIDDLFELHYVQSSDVLTITHPSYAPRELRRLGALNWQLATIAFTPSISPPTSPTASPTAGTGTAANIDHVYVITSLKETTLEESVASVSATASNDLTLQGAFNDVEWIAATDATRYNVYKLSNGLYGYIGQTATLTFTDDNVLPDTSKTPPELSNPFDIADNYPAAVSYFEQRRVFGGTNNKPQSLAMTRSGTESNLSASIPTRDDDAVLFRIAAREANKIQHIVPLLDLILLTSSAVWRVTSVNSDAITPTSISVKPQSYVGASSVQPIATGSSLLYAQARGGRVREVSYSQDSMGRVGYGNIDVTLMAPHLFDFKTITDMAFARTPYPVLWCVSSDGRLLGLTYVPEQKVLGWHQHDTDGLFESVCVVPEGNEDAVYVVVKRSVNGSEVRYVERLHTRQFTTLADAFFVDSGLTYDGTAATVISGLTHLEGKTVNILADGAVMPQQIVRQGRVTLQEAASLAHIGLPITADIKTMPIAVEQIGAFGQGRPKNINKVYLRVSRSSGVFAGPDLAHLREFKQRTTETYGTPPALIESEEIEIQCDPSWNQNGHIFVRQIDPLPLTITSMCLEGAFGG